MVAALSGRVEVPLAEGRFLSLGEHPTLQAASACLWFRRPLQTSLSRFFWIMAAGWHDDLYDFLFLFRNQCDHIILFYVNRKSARVRGDIPLEGACGAAGVHLCASGVFWHDGRVACRAGDGGGDDGALRGVGAAK